MEAENRDLEPWDQFAFAPPMITRKRCIILSITSLSLSHEDRSLAYWGTDPQNGVPGYLFQAVVSQVHYSEPNPPAGPETEWLDLRTEWKF
jgi:hypothetical protein